MASLRVAIAHEWIDAYAGSEQVFEAIAGEFPEADLFALSEEPGVELDLGGRKVTTTALGGTHLRRHRSLTLPLMPIAWRILGSRDYDLVISSHHAFAHTNRLTQSGKHLCYVHSPARYLWTPEIDSRGSGWYLGPVKAALRHIDRAASGHVTAYAANSSAVARRIEKYWGRESTIIHPPVRVEYFAKSSELEPTRDYVLGVGRWIPYKNLHVVIEAAALAGMPVKIAGRGPDKSRIVASAKAANVPVELIESPSDSQLRLLYQNAACLVFPTIEDFGIVPVEALASGTPVVALASGGALDTIQHGVSGVLIDGPADARELSKAITPAMRLRSDDCVQASARFSRSIFSNAISQWVNDCMP